MKNRVLSVYIFSLCALASGALFIQDWTFLGELSGAQLWGFVSLVFLAFLSESLALSVKNAGHSSIIFIPLLACQILFGSAPTLLLVLSVYVPAEILIRRKPLGRAAFNVGQLTIAVALGGILFSALGGNPLADGSASNADFLDQLLPFMTFAVVFLGFNHLAVSWAIALDRGISFRKVWRNRAGRSAANSIYDLLISPIALGVAFLFLELGVLGIVISILPLFFVRHAYLTTYRLQEANRDLLQALVKAIETRDPYTSGHSLRVSQLAGDIAELLGLPKRKVEAIEAAALLHDIGKIEAVYSEILRKPGDLTSREREVIKSHVHKGVALLESLSSFDKEVVAAVRHHHERVDGMGYPDGLAGTEIPLGARIIKVCDAVDAMLSDRPYRDALNLFSVREQLVRYKGSQFDGRIVDLVVDSDILENHQKKIADPAADKATSHPLPATPMHVPMKALH